MELYFGSLARPGDKNDNIVAFTIPDIGVKFKAPFRVPEQAIDYVSLLTLLEFVEINPQLFANRSLELYCNNFDLVEQVSTRTIKDSTVLPYIEKALEYRTKLRYSINWISCPDNPAQHLEID